MLVEIVPGEHGGDPLDQVGDEGPPPGRPGRRAGGQGVRLGQGVQQFQRALRADSFGDRAHGGRVLQVAPGGRVDEQQVMAYEGGEHGHVLAVEADPRGDVLGDDLAGHRVVPGPALADVVQQGGDQEEVGAVDAAGELGGPDGRLDQMPVDGPDVHGVALRAAADPLPVREETGDQSLRLQRLPHVDRRAAGAEQGHKLLARLGGPGRGQGAHGGRQAPHGVQGEREPGLRGGGRGTQGEHGVAFRARSAGEHHLAVLLHHALGQRGALGGRLPAAQHGAQPRPHGARPQYTPHFTPGDITGVRDDARRLIHLPQQGVRVEQPELGGDLVLFLEREPVGRAPGGEVQGVAYVEQPAPGVVEALARGVGQPGCGDGAQDGGVAQTAAGFLQVGFQEVLQLALALGALGGQLLEFGQPPGGLVAPVGQDRCAQSGRQTEVARDVPGVQQAQLDLEVLAGRLAGLGGCANGVVEGEAQVPDRVPDAVSQGGHRAGVGAIVQQEQIKVAARGQLAPAVSPHGDQGQPAQPLGARGEQAGQPLVGQFRERGTARRPGPRLLGEETPR